MTKTDFIHYLNCPKSMWLSKREPENFPAGDFSVFRQKLVNEGEEVERYFRQHFGEEVVYEVEFLPEDLYARADGVGVDEDGVRTLYEVKSSTRVKTDPKHNQLKDACFQKICAERAGQRIDRVVLVHLNGDYVRRGAVDPEELLVFADVTDRVAEIEEETAVEMAAALDLLAGDIDRGRCDCLYKSRGNQCDAFDYFNDWLPDPSIYSLPYLSGERLRGLVDDRMFDPHEVPKEGELGERQRLVLEAIRTGQPQIGREAIAEFLDGLVFPLHFLDYETYASAVPLLDGASPHKHFPIQYSLHVLQEDGNWRHREYLEHEARLPDQLLNRLIQDMGPAGSVIVWHAAFERSVNNEMAEAFREHADFLRDVNERMVDLEDPFKRAYVDAGFEGSTSIKKVLPVVRPGLHYDDLVVQDGTEAMEAWRRMLEAEEEAEDIAQELLEYCKLDTWAMVEIYRFLDGL